MNDHANVSEMKENANNATTWRKAPFHELSELAR
jgi:hypothetical protein